MDDSPTPNLKVLILRAKAGDQAAFEQLYTLYYTPIYRYLFYRLRGNKRDAEDMAQDVFIKIYNSFSHYEPSEANPLPYFYTIARNTLIDSSRKRKVELVNLSEDDTTLENAPDEADLASDSYAKSEDAKELHEKIALLPSEQQDVITLRFIQELSTKETAEALGKTEEAVRQLQSRGLKSLRTLFKT